MWQINYITKSIKTPNKHKCSKCGKGNSDRLASDTIKGKLIEFGLGKTPTLKTNAQEFSVETKEKIKKHLIVIMDDSFTVNNYYHNECEFKVKHYGMGYKKWNEWNRKYRKVRPLVIERDNNTCQICKGKSDKLFKKKFKIVVHHIRKVKDGGTSELHNLVTLCQTCNIVIDHGILAVGAMKSIGYMPTDKECEKHKKMILKKYQTISDKLGIKN